MIIISCLLTILDYKPAEGVLLETMFMCVAYVTVFVCNNFWSNTLQSDRQVKRDFLSSYWPSLCRHTQGHTAVIPGAQKEITGRLSQVTKKVVRVTTNTQKQAYFSSVKHQSDASCRKLAWINDAGINPIVYGTMWFKHSSWWGLMKQP